MNKKHYILVIVENISLFNFRCYISDENFLTSNFSQTTVSCYLSTAAFNDCYSELTPYTALANCYGVSAYDMYQFQGHIH